MTKIKVLPNGNIVVDKRDAEMLGLPPLEGDPYLFVASKIPQFAEQVKEAGYDPENPTNEGTRNAKKTCKRIRSICKVIHLSAGYGAGAFKIWKTLEEQGINITLEEVTEIREMYWRVFQGVIDFGDKLRREWMANKGYYLDGLGIPVSLSNNYEKDIVNRCIQGTGHRILVRYLYHLRNLQPKAVPVVADLHDETIWQCKKEDKQDVINTFKKAWEITNEELGGIIPLYGEPEEHHNFSGFKCE